jgi:hypothetical protein
MVEEISLFGGGGVKIGVRTSISTFAGGKFFCGCPESQAFTPGFDAVKSSF